MASIRQNRATASGTATCTTPRWSDAVHALYGRARMSAQRVLIAEEVLAFAGAFTAEDLHRRVSRRAEGVGLATVYRALGAMQDAGAVAAVGDRGGSALLARCGRSDHHHHLICTGCGSVVSIECPLGQAALAAATREGHLVTRHEITLYGLCATCRPDGADT